MKQTAALSQRQVGSYQQNRRSTTQARLEQLILIDDEVLVEHWDVHATLTGNTNIIVATAKIFLIGQNAQCCSTVLLIAQGDYVWLALLFNPSI